MQKLKVLIADDEQLARQRLTRLLKELPDVEVVGEAHDGHQVLTFINAHDVDVVLLDVQMPKLTGTEALALWPKNGPLVIFCTAFAEHAVKAFDSGAVDYVMKPVEAERLKKALQRAHERETRERFVTEVSRQQQTLQRVPVTTRQGVVLLAPHDITHATLDDELVTIHTREAKLLSDFTLQELEARLPRGPFERVHRRAIVNLEAIARLEALETGGYMARMPSGDSVEISRQAARDLRKRLGLRKATDED